jgi:heat shock protein HslJ
MRNGWLVILVLIIGITVLGTGCAGEPVTNEPFEATTWVLVSYGDPGDPQAALEDVEVTAVFSRESETGPGELNGFAGCNNYFGSFETDGNKLTIGDMGSTEMACEEAIMDQEAQYLSALAAADSYSIEGDRLEISYDGGAEVLTFVAKSGYWIKTDGE